MPKYIENLGLQELKLAFKVHCEEQLIPKAQIPREWAKFWAKLKDSVSVVERP